MDLLSVAYGACSDDEEAESGRLKQPTPTEAYSIPPPKRLRSDISHPPLLPGRYISKRQRERSNTSAATSPSPVVGSPFDSNIRFEALASLRSQAKYASTNKLPTSLSVSLPAHTKPVNSVQWSNNYDHLLASAGMDQSVIIWNVWNTKQPKARILKFHDAAVKDIKWAPQGFSVLSCGFDRASRLVDVENGKEIRSFREDQFVETIRFCPSDSNLFLSGGSGGSIRLWDIRNGSVVKEYLKGLGPILDLEFCRDGKQFVSSSDESKSRISENCIVVWDVLRQVPLSNQVYTEAYTCPCIRYHPYDPIFVAQSNGNYIANFGATRPFRLDKYKRYENHGVSGFPVKCNFSSDGKELASGSSDGFLYFYEYKSCKFLCKLKAFEEPCIDVVYHPTRHNVIASCSWNGEVAIFE
ncbi:WD repeat-containing protein 25 [Carex littledalei]|uniref:WD repeat-containing protein 25 n=1 Tax=Carex littledalei TaxID=544730 RepID=A0A833QIH8_9POAL|nr:WD repeat-containing protein 25 [Carex littledalei]